MLLDFTPYQSWSRKVTVIKKLGKLLSIVSISKSEDSKQEVDEIKSAINYIRNHNYSLTVQAIQDLNALHAKYVALR